MRKPCGFVRFFALCLAALSLGAAGDSGFPGAPGSDPWAHRPNNPDYPNQWQLYSHLPEGFRGEMSDAERALGAGMSVDKAWQWHTGTPETVIAVLDSGIEWETPGLIDQIRLNMGELPPPLGSAAYDRRGGRAVVSDYRNDPRVHPAGPLRLLTAGDLVRAFSNGVDDDHNGYVDDIAGWDFHEGRNDPADRVWFGHGTGEAADAASGLDNATGEAGVCGHCAVLPVRVNDSFVVDANAFARAVRYAVDNGASVIQEALGAANHNAFTQAALDYAYQHDVVVIGSAADEDSYHHNYPGTLDPVVYTDALRFDTSDPLTASTFTNLNNCSNYGARVDVATSGLHCSSEATSNLGGIAGLAVSYARSLGAPLTAGELISLIKTSATDINYGAADPARYPTYPGWDATTGYGRTNALKMLDAIRTGDVPPEARIVSPAWFASYANQEAGGIEVVVQARTPRSGSAKLRLEVARGVETSGTTFALVQESPILRQGVEGVFATVPFSLLASLPANTRDVAHDANAFTLRLTVDDLKGHVAEARRTFFAFHDDLLLPGFPRRLAGSGESSGLFIDLAGDGKAAYVTADGGGYVHAFTATGDELPGFPAGTAPSRYGPGVQAAVYAPVAAGDLAGDGRTEIVAVSMEGHVSVLGADGRMRPGFPVQLPFPDMRQAVPAQVIAPGALASPVLVDLSACYPPAVPAGHHLDIVVPGLDGRLYAFQPDGAAVPGFPVELRAEGHLAKLVSSPAVADVEADGCPDLVLGSNHVGEAAGYLFAVSGRGTLAKRPLLAGFPTRVPVLRDTVLPTVGTGIPTAPVVADLTGTGQKQIVVHGFIGKVYLVGMDGRLARSLDMAVSAHQQTNDQYMIPAFGHPAVGDLLGDGKTFSPVTVGAGQRMLVALALGGRKYDYNHMVGAWDPRTGAMLDGFPKVNDDMALNVSPVLADLDGSGRAAVIASSGGYYMHAWGPAGEMAGFPHFTGGSVFGSASAGDMEGNGQLVLAATTREGYVYAWRTQGRATAWQATRGWLTFKGNPQRTGTR